MSKDFFIFDPITLEVKPIKSEVIRDLTNFTLKKLNLYKSIGKVLPKINCFVVDKDTPSSILKKYYSSMKYEDEVFVKCPIDNFDFYEVSNYGRIRNSKRLEGVNNGLLMPSRLCKKKQKYLAVYLTGADRKRREFTIHKLVMFSFYGKPSYNYYIHHKDGCYYNDVIGNLEYRKRDSKVLSKWSKMSRLAKNKSCKSIAKYSLNGECLAIYKSIADASKDNYISRDVISYAAKSNKEKFGYKWKFS